MKKQILLIIAFLVMISNLFAQNLEPAQYKFNYKGSLVYLDRHSDFRALDTTFNLLWHWYNGKKMSKSLGVNLVHISPIDFWGRAGNTTYLYCDTNDLRNVADSVYMKMDNNRFSHISIYLYAILAFPHIYALS